MRASASRHANATMALYPIAAMIAAICIMLRPVSAGIVTLAQRIAEGRVWLEWLQCFHVFLFDFIRSGRDGGYGGLQRQEHPRATFVGLKAETRVKARCVAIDRG